MVLQTWLEARVPRSLAENSLPRIERTSQRVLQRRFIPSLRHMTFPPIVLTYSR